MMYKRRFPPGRGQVESANPDARVRSGRGIFILANPDGITCMLEPRDFIFERSRMKPILLQVIKPDELYSNVNTRADEPILTVARDYGETPNGNEMNGRWVLKRDGVYVDHDQYRSDLGERNGIELEFEELWRERVGSMIKYPGYL